MGQRITGPGVGLPPPQNYYPFVLYNAPQDPSSNVWALPPGATQALPAGNLFVDLGGSSVLQYLDPVNSIWDLPHSGQGGGVHQLFSDGYNVRVANLTGCPVCAVITNAGSGYPTNGTTVTSGGSGGSTWTAVVGGQLSVSTVSVAGAGYGVPPLVLIPPPPSPGVQASAYAIITGGSVSAVSLSNVGAGYTTAPTAVIVPSPFDPNVVAGNAITQATVVLGAVGAGSLSAVLCTNPGASVASAPSLTISGTGGSSAAATANLMLTCIGATVYAAGAGYIADAAMTSIGGAPSATPVITNPLSEGRAFRPRPMQVLLAAVGNSITSVSAIYDGGLFIGTPYEVVSPLHGALITTSASVVGLYGGTVSSLRVQYAP